MDRDPLRAELLGAVSRAGTVRRLLRARWVAIVVAALQLAAFDSSGLDRRAFVALYALLVVLAAANVVLRRMSDHALGTRPLVLATLGLDAVVLIVFVVVLAFDPSSSTYVLLVMIPMEAALYFGVHGALWGWGVALIGLVLREFAEAAVGDPVQLTAITFRAGTVLVIAYAVGSVVAERDEQRRRTEAALVQVTHGDQWRQRLIAALAHDVRAPLAGARESLATVHHHFDRLSTELAQAVLVAGIRQADRGLLLARDLLDMAASESAGLVMHRTAVDLGELVPATVALSSAADAVVTVPGHVVVSADAARLEQVVHNLVANAVAHGRAPIEVDVSRTPDGIELSVRDHGDGVADTRQLFTAFGGTGGTESVGLGLWLVRSLVEAHGGTVHHEPAHPGARFVVTLPHTPAPADTPDPRDRDRLPSLDRLG